MLMEEIKPVVLNKTRIEKQDEEYNDATFVILGISGLRWKAQKAKYSNRVAV